MYKEIILNPLGGKRFDASLYKDLNDTGNFGCIYAQYSGYNKAKTYSLKISKNFNRYTKEDIEEYVKFLNNAGFPISIIEEEYYYAFVFSVEDYPTYNNLLCAYTSLRYMFVYNYGDVSDNLPQIAISLKNKYSELIDEIEALQIAHYFVYSSYIDGLHCLLGSVSALVSKEEVLERMKNNCSVNNTFYNKIDIEWNVLQKTFHKDFLSALKLVKPSLSEK